MLTDPIGQISLIIGITKLVKRSMEPAGEVPLDWAFKENGTFGNAILQLYQLM